MSIENTPSAWAEKTFNNWLEVFEGNQYAATGQVVLWLDELGCWDRQTMTAVAEKLAEVAGNRVFRAVVRDGLDFFPLQKPLQQRFLAVAARK